jgi:hypothetical protein
MANASAIPSKIGLPDRNSLNKLGFGFGFAHAIDLRLVGEPQYRRMSRYCSSNYPAGHSQGLRDQIGEVRIAEASRAAVNKKAGRATCGQSPGGPEEDLT